MSLPTFRSDRSLEHEFRVLARTRARDACHRTIAPARAHLSDELSRHAQLGVAVVEVVASDLCVTPVPEAPHGARIAVLRTEEGRFWELLVLDRGVPAVRVVAGLRRSRKPPWRLTRLTYFATAYGPKGGAHV